MDLTFFGGLLGVLTCRVQHKLSDLSEFPGFWVFTNWGVRPIFGHILKMAV